MNAPTFYRDPQLKADETADTFQKARRARFLLSFLSSRPRPEMEFAESNSGLERSQA
jgi:hypothetical protein